MTRHAPIRWTARARLLGDLLGLAAITVLGALIGLAVWGWLW